jgi:mannonate dehydratase
MKIALYLLPFNEHTMKLARQIGVTDIVTFLPPEQQGPIWEFMPLLHHRKRIEDAELRWSAVESITVADRIKLGLPGRDQDIDNFCQSIRNIGAAGISILCYNFMSKRWFRTSNTTRSRGEALVTSFDYKLIEHAPLTEAGQVSDEQMWDNFEYFLKRVVPVAEEANVKLALHPDDPPMSPLRGLARIMRSPEAFQRVIDMVPSDHNGLTLCCGSFATMGVDVVKTIQHFGRQNKIFFAHFRNVRGTCPAFEETFHDDGDLNMAAVMKAFMDVGFDGPIRPDHVPTLQGEENDRPGYMIMGRLHAVGYMKGLCHGLTLDT